jgi:hypothetical protein
MTESAVHVIAQVVKPKRCDVDGDRAGFDLREIENVVDQGEQIHARSVDGARVFHLPWLQIAVYVLGQLIGRIRRLFNGVRSSCDIFDTNSDLL